MVGYDDPYNRGVTQKMNTKIAAHALKIDQLNGSGKNNKGGAKCCANCACGKKCKGGNAATPIAAKKWFESEDKNFENQIHQTITSPEVRNERMKLDLGAGKFAMRGRGNELSSNRNITPPSVAHMRMKLDLGAGKFQGGAREEYYEEDDDYEHLEGGAGEEDEDYSYDEDDYEDGDDNGELEGGAAEDVGYEEPESLREMKSICQDYEEHRLTGGAMTKRVRSMLPHGKKSMSSSLSKLLKQLKKRGRASFARRVKRRMMVPTAPQQGSGRYVGGAKDHADIERIHDSIFGGSKLSGGYGPVAPTTEALQGYDNRNQPTGMMPPPSVNQQPGMRGGRRARGSCEGGISFGDLKQKAGEFWEKHKGKIGTAAALASAAAAAAAAYKSQKKGPAPQQQQQQKPKAPPPNKEPDVAPKMNMDDFMKDEPTGPLCKAKGYSANPNSKAECKKAYMVLHPDKNRDCEALANRKFKKIQGDCARMGLGQGRIRGGALPLGNNAPVAKKARPNAVVGAAMCAKGTAGNRAHALIPEAQLPSRIGGGRFSKKGDYIGPSTGAIIPNLQSDVSPQGSGVAGAKMSRGAMVARLMKEKGMSLGEASKALKGGAYTANDFFMPKNIHQFFGAYA